MATTVSDTDDVLVDCRSVWKVFGNKAPVAMRAIAERGLGKREVLQEFGCVVGVSDATMQVRRGEIFCVMGLSGSGKSTLIRMLHRLIEPSGGQVFVKGKEYRSSARPSSARSRPATSRWCSRASPFCRIGRFSRMPPSASRSRACQGRPQSDRRSGADQGRPRRLAAALPGRAFGRHAAARRAGPGPGRRPGDHPDGRAVQRPRPADSSPAAGRVPPADQGPRQVRGLHHP